MKTQFFVFLSSLLLLSACSPELILIPFLGDKVSEWLNEENDEVKVGKLTNISNEELLQEANQVSFLIDSGRLLNRANSWDHERIRSIIERVKVAAILLDENPNNRSALLSLKGALQFYNEVFIAERDKPRFDGVFSRAFSLLVTYANIQGVNVDDVRWTLFSYRFSETVSPFGSSDVPNLWSIRPVQQERYAINVRGENKQAVLLTPTFDLTNTSNPGYQLRHSFQLEEHFIPRPAFDREKILNEAFRVYVSTNYRDGESVNFRDRSKWERVGLGNLPLGLNFNTVDSGIISLKQFAGKKITMALVYRNGADLNNHLLSWAIERFELYGVSPDFNYTERPVPFNPDAQDVLGDTIWEHDFNRVQLGNLEQFTLEGSPADFRDTERNGVKYVSAGSRGTLGTKVLHSAPILIEEGAAPFVRIEHTINFYDEEFRAKKNVKMVAAIDDPSLSPEQLNWITIDFEKNNPPGSDWNIYKTEFVPLPSDFIGKEVRIGLSHTSEEDSSPAWQIHQIDLRDIPELQ